MYRTYRLVCRRLLSGIFFLLLLFPMFAVKSCSAGAGSEAAPAVYSWFGMLFRSRDIDLLALCPPIAAMLLFIISFAVIKKISLLPLYLELVSLLAAALAGATLLFYPSLSFLFDSVQYKPAYFAAAVIPPIFVLDSVHRIIASRQNIPAGAHRTGFPVHIQCIRIVNIAAAVVWLLLPFLGTAQEKISGKDIAAMAAFFIFFWTPFMLMQLTVNRAFAYREKWAFIASTIVAIISLAGAGFLAAGMLRH